MKETKFESIIEKLKMLSHKQIIKNSFSPFDKVRDKQIKVAKEKYQKLLESKKVLFNNIIEEIKSIDENTFNTINKELENIMDINKKIEIVIKILENSNDV